MMMPSTMILTTCISMVLKRNRGLSLDIGSRYERAEHKTHNSNHKSQKLDTISATNWCWSSTSNSKLWCDPSPLLFIIIIIIIMKRLKQRLTLKSNQSNDDWYRNVFKRRPKVSRDDAIDQTGKTTAISVTMLITIAKTVSDGFGGRLAFAASLYVCPLQNDGQPSSMLDRDWGGGRSRPPKHKFSVTSVGVIFNQWGG